MTKHFHGLRDSVLAHLSIVGAVVDPFLPWPLCCAVLLAQAS